MLRHCAVLEYAELQVSVRADGNVSLLYLDRDAFNRCARALAACCEMQRTAGGAEQRFQLLTAHVCCAACAAR